MKEPMIEEMKYSSSYYLWIYRTQNVWRGKI